MNIETVAIAGVAAITVLGHGIHQRTIRASRIHKEAVKERLRLQRRAESAFTRLLKCKAAHGKRGRHKALKICTRLRHGHPLPQPPLRQRKRARNRAPV